MLASNTNTTTSDIVNLQIQLEVMREKDKNHLEKIAQLEQSLREAQIEIGIRDQELKQTVAQNSEQKAQLGTLKYKDEKIDELEDQLREKQRECDTKSKHLEEVIKTSNEQKMTIAVYEEKFKRLRQINPNDKLISLLASLLFMLAAGLGSIGYNLITSVTGTSPNMMGVVLIGMAVAFQVLATLLVTFCQRR